MSTARKFKHAVVYGDTHYPFHDTAALKIVKEIVKDVRPDVLVHIGDLVDCWQVSRFDKDPRRKDSLQDNINEAAAHLKEMFMLTPEAQRFFIEGNHEFRLHKTLARFTAEQREIIRLDILDGYISWPNILAKAGVSQQMWEFVPTRGQARRRIFPNLVVKHGSKVTKWSAGTARAEWERYGMSGISGHTHRLGAFYHSDFNGAHGWAETGCTCDLQPEYVEDPDWQHGCVVITFTNDWKYFAFEPVYIQEGHAIWRDNRW